jgi:CRISPR-associated protein Cmr6
MRHKHRPLYADITSKMPHFDNTNGHWGLWFERFFDAYPQDFDPKKDQESKKQWTDDKSTWIQQFHNKPAGGRKACQIACERQRNLCKVLNNDVDGERLPNYIRVLNVDWHFVTGMGLPHPIENGFLWHPTLGTPYLPGSSIKGLLRSWVEVWDEGSDKDAKLLRWFGSESQAAKNSDKDNQTGNLIFFDAIPSEPPSLKVDIMTPHMGKWYESDSETTNYAEDSEAIPADWHDPNPIQFLVADQPVFQFAIAQRPNSLCQIELKDVMDALQEALEWLGAGAKTAVGYGYGSLTSYKPPAPSDKPQHPKLKEIFKIIDESSPAPIKNAEVWGGKKLAELWGKIQDQSEKASALKEIEAYWQYKEWWEKPPNSKKRQTKKIYTGEVE